MGHEAGSVEGVTRAGMHHGAVLKQGSSCTQAGPAPIPFCIVFLKSVAEGMPGQGCSGQLLGHSLGLQGFAVVMEWAQEGSSGQERFQEKQVAYIFSRQAWQQGPQQPGPQPSA